MRARAERVPELGHRERRVGLEAGVAQLAQRARGAETTCSGESNSTTTGSGMALLRELVLQLLDLGDGDERNEAQEQEEEEEEERDRSRTAMRRRPASGGTRAKRKGGSRDSREVTMSTKRSVHMPIWIDDGQRPRARRAPSARAGTRAAAAATQLQTMTIQ